MRPLSSSSSLSSSAISNPSRHSRERGNPGAHIRRLPWTPAFAGVTIIGEKALFHREGSGFGGSGSGAGAVDEASGGLDGWTAGSGAASAGRAGYRHGA